MGLETDAPWRERERAGRASASRTTSRRSCRTENTLELARHREIIKKARPGPARDAAKRRALQVLKQKRLYENQREQLYNQQFNLEQVGFATQTAKETVVQVEAMRAANKGAF